MIRVLNPFKIAIFVGNRFDGLFGYADQHEGFSINLIGINVWQYAGIGIVLDLVEPIFQGLVINHNALDMPRI